MSARIPPVVRQRFRCLGSIPLSTTVPASRNTVPLVEFVLLSPSRATLLQLRSLGVAPAATRPFHRCCRQISVSINLRLPVWTLSNAECYLQHIYPRLWTLTMTTEVLLTTPESKGMLYLHVREVSTEFLQIYTLLDFARRTFLSPLRLSALRPHPSTHVPYPAREFSR